MKRGGRDRTQLIEYSSIINLAMTGISECDLRCPRHPADVIRSILLAHRVESSLGFATPHYTMLVTNTVTKLV